MTHFLLVATNRFGVLARITAIVSATGTNICTAAVYPVGDSTDVSIVHLGVDSDTTMAERLRRKLMRLADIIEVRVERHESPLSIDMGRYLEKTA